ncbi:mediator of RNA polymerase II transcription subunit 15-like [Battus philenor]|uniref:mediator of RNA polymerase II transcription subunit 15-like n=1 Tax=Battus philenor TaxID=42288 RepID=UPI0035CEEC13
MKHAFTLGVITLLQLCGAEILDALPEWYAVNLINDASYQPKPITEIFTTPAAFTSTTSKSTASTEVKDTSETEVALTTATNAAQTPVKDVSTTANDATQRVVPLQQITSISSRPLEGREQRQVVQPPEQQIQVLLAQPPQSQLGSEIQQFGNGQIPRIQPSRQIQQSSQIQISPQTQLSSQEQQSPRIQPSQNTQQPLQTQTSPQITSSLQNRPFPPIQSSPRNQTYPQIPPSLQNRPFPQIESSPQNQTSPQIAPSFQNRPSPQFQSSLQMQPFPQILSTPPRQNQQQTTGSPNYFLIYQQAPLSVQQFPESASQLRPSSQAPFQIITQEPTTKRTTQEVTSPTTVTQPTVIIKEIKTNLPNFQTSTNQKIPTLSFTKLIPWTREEPRFVTSPPILFGGSWQDPSTTPGDIFSSPPISSTISPNIIISPNTNDTGINARPNIITSRHPTQEANKIPSLTIRVSAPRGSITNININPSTTTNKPSTRRPQRRKGNNYNVCVESCKGKREPICGAPLAVLPIDPNKLKGFPSICHLACHNSFRKNQPYEKIMDGRCSKLRTRIRTFDKNKLKREELNKTQYTVLSNSQDTVVQIIPNERSG